jgi:cell pole-organizing protein PopZ
MSEQAAPEPTMEEILASIRRIISEDDAPAAEAAEAHEEPAAAFEPAPEPEPEPEPEDAHEDVLELTERIAPAASIGDIDAYEKPAPAPVIAPSPASAPVFSRKVEERLVSEPSATAAASAFENLSASIPLPPVGRTLEDLAGELLRPLLKSWLDENLPRIVEAKVAEEVERIARSRVR